MVGQQLAQRRRAARGVALDGAAADAEGFVRKVAFIDLTKIANPKRLAKLGPNEDSFVLPHLGPEGLTIVDATHIVTVNDNNFPYSSGRQIGKPDDDADARRMLRLLSGRTHQVHTAVVAWRMSGLEQATVTTDVTFVHLDERLIDWYVATGEPADKAGAYGIQGAAGALVERIDGSPTNVIGLPLAETVGLLRRSGLQLGEIGR